MKNIKIREIRSLGDRFPATFEYFFSEFSGFIKPFLIYAAPLLLIIGGYSSSVTSKVFEVLSEQSDPGEMPDFSLILSDAGLSTAKLLFIGLLGLVASILVMSIFGSYMRLREDMHDRRPNAAEVFRHALPRMLQVLVLLILSYIAFFVGSLLLLVGALIVGVFFAAAYPAIFMEDASATESIARSFSLTKKNFFSTLGFFLILVITVLFTFIIVSFLMQPLNTLGLGLMNSMPILGIIIMGIAGIINQIINTLIYIGQFLHYGHLSEKEDNQSFENEINAL